MLFNTTHKNDEAKTQTNDLLGKPYNFIESIKLGGIGSKRMIIDGVSPKLLFLKNTVSDLNYCSIELRPKGIIVFITKGLQNFSWIIPFWQLVIYKTSGISIHDQGNFIRIKNNKLLKENKSFFKKLADLKINNVI